MNRILSIALLALIGIGAFFLFRLPVNIAGSIRAPGRTVLAREWNLVRNTDGGLATLLYDRVNGTIRTTEVTRFDRGDAVDFRLHSAVAPGAVVGMGDTVGVLSSNSLDLLLQQTRGQLETARASLSLYRSGEKDAIVTEARNRIALARQQAEAQRNIVDRQRRLYEKGYLPQQDFETAESTLRMYEISVSIAESQMRTVETGSKPEQIAVIESELQSLERAVSTLEKRIERQVIRAPFRGVVCRFASGDTLLTLGEHTGYLVSMPVSIADIPRISRDRDVVVRVQGIDSVFRGKILRIDSMAGVLQGRQVLTVTAFIPSGSDGLLPGLIVACSIPGEPVSAGNYFGALLRGILVH